MKIGIDARMYGPRHSGLGRYVEQLIEQLKDIDTDNEYVIFLKHDTFDLFVLPSAKWKKVLADVHWYGVEEQLKMPRIIKKEQVDLMHFPHWNIPLMYRGPFVVTIHDLIMFHYVRKDATTHGPVVFWIKDMLHRFVVHSAAKRAKHIFATSEFTKHDIVKTLNVDEQKINVTYQAPFSDHRESTINNNAVLQKNIIGSPYVLYVGNAYPHKNLTRLIAAFKKVNTKMDDTHQLVLVGKKSKWYSVLEDSVGFDSSIVFTGFVTDEELNELYEHAVLYAFPSLYEGFGLPPLEAMMHGIPVVSSNASCMPEVLGSAALYFDPESVEDMARVIGIGLSHEDIRYTLQQQAKEELKKYSWKHLGEKTLRIYNMYL